MVAASSSLAVALAVCWLLPSPTWTELAATKAGDGSLVSLPFNPSPFPPDSLQLTSPPRHSLAHPPLAVIEGLLSVVVGAISYWLLADFPDNAKFLSEPERKAVVGRLQADQQFSAAGEGFEWRNIWKSLLDWKTWIGALVYMGSDGPLYAFSVSKECETRDQAPDFFH